MWEALLYLAGGGAGLKLIELLFNHFSKKRKGEAETQSELAEADRKRAEADKLRAEAARENSAQHKLLYDTAMNLVNTLSEKLDEEKDENKMLQSDLNLARQKLDDTQKILNKKNDHIAEIERKLRQLEEELKKYKNE